MRELNIGTKKYTKVTVMESEIMMLYRESKKCEDWRLAFDLLVFASEQGFEIAGDEKTIEPKP